MALYTFGGTPADVLTDLEGDVVTDYLVLVRRTGGALVTALLEADGVTPIPELRTGATGSPAPGAIRTFKIEDVTEILYEYLDNEGQPVQWYQAARELAAGAHAAADAALTEAQGKLDLDETDPQTVAGQVDFESPITAPNLTDLPGMRWFAVTGAVGDGVEDDREAIQDALDAADAAGGGIVHLPAGYTYGVGNFLVVKDHVTIWAYGATIKAIGNTGILRNFTSGETFAEYAGHSHITVLGGTWDGNADDGSEGTVTAMTNVMTFCHATDITVRDATIKNISSAHGCELNAIDGGRVLSCTFEGYIDNSGDDSRQFSEAVQIDIAKSGSSSIGDFDDTPSRNILVQGCTFRASDRLGPFGRAVGSHTLAAGKTYDHIRVLDNHIEETIREGIHAYGWKHARIAGNTLTGTGRSGILATLTDPASTAVSPHSLVIDGNTIEGPGDDSGIRVISYAAYKYPGVVISANTVRDVTGNGIHAEHCAGPAITGNHVETTTSTGIYAHMSDQAAIVGNSVRDTGSNGINVAGSVGAVVAGNVVHGTDTNFGIFVGQSSGGTTDATDALVTGNTVAAAASAGIRCSTNAVRCRVAGNTVRKAGASTTNGITLAASATGCTVENNDLTGNSWSAATALSLSTALPATGPGGMQASPGTNRVDTDLTVGTALEAAMKPTGRYETCSRLHVGTASTAPSGTLVLVPIWLPAGLVVSNISFTSGSTGATSPTNYWFMLLDKNRVALARTADQTTTAWAANTRKTLAIAQTTAGAASSYTTTYEGLHYLGVMIAASAAPNLIGEGTCSTVHVDSPALGSSDTGQTTPPTVTAGAFTAAAPSSGLGYLFHGYVT